VRRALLDVNVLLALPDSDHADHERAGEWLDAEVEAGWASCPVTEHGFVRIISQPRCPSPISPARAVELLAAAQGAATTRSGPAT
jgi:toxin-antitoxin system PIN domain toxin